MTILMHNRVPRDDLALGLVRAEGVGCGPAPAALALELDRWIQRRAAGALAPDEEALRKGSRDILRNGKYKPTGRGKPASEYLVRAASDGSFPRINGPVDANNLVSLRHCVAVSLWDHALAACTEYELRLGREDETYVFNQAGQTLRLRDLVCGSAMEGDVSRPLVTPIKDSLATKLRPETSSVVGCIYYPLTAGSVDRLAQMADEFFGWLQLCGMNVTGATAVALPGSSAMLYQGRSNRL